MKVQELIDRLNYLLNNNYLNQDDEVLLIGTGDRETGLISSVCIPSIIPNFKEHTTGYYHIGFYKKKLNAIDNGFNSRL